MKDMTRQCLFQSESETLAWERVGKAASSGDRSSENLVPGANHEISLLKRRFPATLYQSFQTRRRSRRARKHVRDADLAKGCEPRTYRKCVVHWKRPSGGHRRRD